MSRDRLYTMDVFAGIGGLTEASERSNRLSDPQTNQNLQRSLFKTVGNGLVRPTDAPRYETLAQLDNEPYSAAILENRFPNSLTIDQDIRNFYRFTHEYPCYFEVHDDDWNCETDCGDICEMKWCPDHEERWSDCECIGHSQFRDYVADHILPEDVNAFSIDVLSGGFPCKNTSVAANAQDTRYGLDGEKSGLWNEQKRLLDRFNPPFGVIENTAGLSGDMGRLLSDLDDLGYGAVSFYLTAGFAGADHQRRRHFLIISDEHEARTRFGLDENTDIIHDLANCLADEQYMDAMTEETFWEDKTYDGPLVAQRGEVENLTERLKALGNAVVPDQARPLYDTIKDVASDVAEDMVDSTVVLGNPVAVRREDGSYEDPDGNPINPDSDIPGRCIMRDGKIYSAEDLKFLSSRQDTEFQTPVARDYKGGSSESWFSLDDPEDTNYPTLPDQLADMRGQSDGSTRHPTNPEFAEFLMGYDEGFTELDGVTVEAIRENIPDLSEYGEKGVSTDTRPQAESTPDETTDMGM